MSGSGKIKISLDDLSSPAGDGVGDNGRVKVAWREVNDDSYSQPPLSSMSWRPPNLDGGSCGATVVNGSSHDRRWLAIAAGAVVSVILAVLIVYAVVDYNRRDSIKTVLREACSALKSEYDTLGKLRRIDVSGCPEDFQKAYNEFVDACAYAHEFQGGSDNRLFNYAFLLGFALVTDNWIPLVGQGVSDWIEGADTEQMAQAAWENLWRVAEEYGVDAN